MLLCHSSNYYVVSGASARGADKVHRTDRVRASNNSVVHGASARGADKVHRTHQVKEMKESQYRYLLSRKNAFRKNIVMEHWTIIRLDIEIFVLLMK